MDMPDTARGKEQEADALLSLIIQHAADARALLAAAHKQRVVEALAETD